MGTSLYTIKYNVAYIFWPTWNKLNQNPSSDGAETLQNQV